MSRASRTVARLTHCKGTTFFDNCKFLGVIFYDFFTIFALNIKRKYKYRNSKLFLISTKNYYLYEMDRLKLITAFIVSLLCTCTLGAWEPVVSSVKNIGLDEGLSSQRVFSIVEDGDGVVWISTKMGVNRCNGKEITFYELPGDLRYDDMAARVIKLYHDSDRLLAFDNSGNIYKYSDVFDRFETVMRLSDIIDGNIRLNCIARTSTDYLLFGLTQGLYACNVKSKEVTILRRSLNVNDIHEYGGTLFVGTNKGLYIFYPSQSNSYDNTNDYKVVLAKQNVSTILALDDAYLLGTANAGVWELNPEDGSVSRIECADRRINYPVRSIIRLYGVYCAVGTDGEGIFLYDSSSKELTRLADAESEGNCRLEGIGIYTLCMDRHGDIWAGSYNGGVSVLTMDRSPFTYIRHVSNNPQSIAIDKVNDIEENTDGSIWFATDLGVSVFDKGKWFHPLTGSVGVSLCKGKDGDMLLGSYGDGLFLIDSKGNVRNLNSPDSEASYKSIFSIASDARGDYWVGTLNGELMLLDSDYRLKKTFGISPSFCIIPMDENNMAVASADGFFTIDINDGTVVKFASQEEFAGLDESSYYVCMLFNGDGSVWLCSEGGGLLLYDMNRRRILKTYKTGDGLPSNDIYSICKDREGRCWVSTGNGISMIDGDKVTSIIEKGNEYNKNAYTVLSNGDFVFGSTSGAVRFDPMSVKVTDYPATLKINGLIVDSAGSDEKDRLQEQIYDRISHGRTVTLKNRFNSFHVVFESINLRNAKDIAYSWMLEGYDEYWSELSEYGLARYKNVSPGRYILKLKSVRRGNNTVIGQTELPVTVLQPWWNSIWAWIVYVLIIAALSYLVYGYAHSRMQDRSNKEKMRFFINTVHDIRTPVTLIMSPLEELLKDEKLSSNAMYLAGIARQNAGKLNAISTKLLEFEKFENDSVDVEWQSLDIVEVMSAEIECFRVACEKKGVDLVVDMPDSPACIHSDKHLLERLFDNIMSNACKYTPAGGQVKVSVKTDAKNVFVYISDTGIGIPQKARKHIFKDVYRAKNARDSQELGTGFGLLQVRRIADILSADISYESRENAGTSFRVVFNRIFDQAVQFAKTDSSLGSIEELMTSDSVEFEVSKVKTTRILIVEDDDNLRDYLRNAFSSEFSVAVANDPKEALIIMEKSYPDLILSDLIMPGMRGDDFCNLIKSNPDTAGIPVILLTGNADHESMVEGFRKGADDYIIKPFSIEILKLKVHSMVESRAQLRERMMSNAISSIESDGTDTGSTVESELDSNSGGNDREFIAKATKLVFDNISDSDFTIDRLCQEMAMSRTLFYSRLKSLTGKAPQEFIRILRLNRAAELLRQGMSVIEASEATGFVNVKYFSTLFKKQFGLQPSKYPSEES